MASNDKFKNYLPIQGQKDHLLKICKSKAINNQVPKPNNTILSSILTSIKNKTLSLEELNNLDLPNYQKAILTMAMYEAENYGISVSICFLKSLKQKYNDNKEMLTIIKKLNERLKVKRKLFDTNFYLKLLSIPVVETPNFNAIKEERENILRLLNVLNIIRAERISNAETPPSTGTPNR